jgi:hypothetical protein
VETNSVGAYDVLDEAICQNCATLWRREMLAEVEAESLRELQLVAGRKLACFRCRTPLTGGTTT